MLIAQSIAIVGKANNKAAVKEDKHLPHKKVLRLIGLDKM
jgi:hypothetical protein